MIAYHSTSVTLEEEVDQFEGLETRLLDLFIQTERQREVSYRYLEVLT